LTIRKRFFGDYHPKVAASYNNIGSVFYQRDDLPQAIQYFEKALAVLTNDKMKENK
jgi:Tfp pilus assembly protein PilF